MQSIRLNVIKLMYCGFVGKVEGQNKVVYGVQFPPSSGTIKPDFSVDSTSSELEIDDHIDKSTFVNFITSEKTRQVNGKWKGGRWGTNNFTVTSETWLPGLFIGDSLEFSIIKEGIIKFTKTPFKAQDEILVLTEDKAISCNATWKGNAYPVYLTDNIMPQKACDKLFIWCSPNKTMIKIMRRGVGPNVDSPNRIIPAAGEHLEPGQSLDSRDQVLFAINQEIGIPKETLNKCYLLNLGNYSDDGRDPRYWSYCTMQPISGSCCSSKSEIIEFSIKRYSSTNAQILLLVTDDNVEPLETTQEDQEEIKSKWWEDISTVLDNHKEDEWMLEDHMKFIPDAIKKIEEFKQCDHLVKELYKF